MRTTLACLAAACVVLAAGGCSSDPTIGSDAGVTILLTDAPLDLSTVSAVNVTLTEVLLYPADGEDDEAMKMERIGGSDAEGLTLNLLNFQNGKTIAIAKLDVPPGRYSKLRFRISAADLVHDHDDDPQTPEAIDGIFISSGKVDVPVAFTVSGGDKLELTIDFDAALSVQVNETQGQHPYILRPVLTPAGVTLH
jgi:hypothetical protein